MYCYVKNRHLICDTTLTQWIMIWTYVNWHHLWMLPYTFPVFRHQLKKFLYLLLCKNSTPKCCPILRVGSLFKQQRGLHYLRMLQQIFQIIWQIVLKIFKKIFLSLNFYVKTDPLLLLHHTTRDNDLTNFNLHSEYALKKI